VPTVDAGVAGANVELPASANTVYEHQSQRSGPSLFGALTYIRAENIRVYSGASVPTSPVARDLARFDVCIAS
jgi:hypothetical protein